MHKTATAILISLLVLLMVGSLNCILDEKVIEIVVSGRTCAEFSEDEDSATWNDTLTIDYGDTLQKILDDNDIERDSIQTAHLVSVYYTVTAIDPDQPDWVVDGEITIARGDIAAGPATLINYTDQNVKDALDVEIYADLNPDGVTIINQALEQFRVGTHNPTLVFEVINDGVVPDPATQEVNMIFTWKACLTIQVVSSQEFEAPDAF
jgi:hypothetical protein